MWVRTCARTSPRFPPSDERASVACFHSPVQAAQNRSGRESWTTLRRASGDGVRSVLRYTSPGFGDAKTQRARIDRLSDGRGDRALGSPTAAKNVTHTLHSHHHSRTREDEFLSLNRGNTQNKAIVLSTRLCLLCLLCAIQTQLPELSTSRNLPNLRFASADVIWKKSRTSPAHRPAAQRNAQRRP